MEYPTGQIKECKQSGRITGGLLAFAYLGQPLFRLAGILTVGGLFDDLPVKLYRVLQVMLLFLELGCFKQLLPLVSGTPPQQEEGEEQDYHTPHKVTFERMNMIC